MKVGVAIVVTSRSLRCRGSYLESQASPSRHRERYAFRVTRAQSGLAKLSAAFANSIAVNQPGGLQVSHWMRANSTGLVCTLAAPPSMHRNHWYQKRLAWSNEGIVKRPCG